jgi:HSP20 family protein
MFHRADPLGQLRPLREDEIAARGSADHRAAAPLAYDVYRQDDDLVIDFEVPGVDPAELQVAVEDRSLVVTVHRQLAHGRSVDIVQTGRQHGDFRVRLLLSERCDLDRLVAEVRHGVLNVRAPLREVVSRRHIEVAGEGARPDAAGARPGASAVSVDSTLDVHSAA